MKILPGRTLLQATSLTDSPCFRTVFMSSSMPFRWSSLPFKEWNSSESRRLKQRIPGSFAKSHQPGHRAHPALLHRCFIRHYGNHSLEDDLRTRQSVRSNLFSGRNSGCRFYHQLCRHRCRLFDFEQRHLFNRAPPVSTGTRISQPEDEVFDESFRSRHSRQQRFVFCFSHAVCANS